MSVRRRALYRFRRFYQEAAEIAVPLFRYARVPVSKPAYMSAGTQAGVVCKMFSSLETVEITDFSNKRYSSNRVNSADTFEFLYSVPDSFVVFELL